jgi:hypothetical protein
MAIIVNVVGVQMQSGPVPRTKKVITECYKWHTTAEETRNLKASFTFPSRTPTDRPEN